MIADRPGAAHDVLAQTEGVDDPAIRLTVVRSALTRWVQAPDPDTLHDLTVDGYAAGAMHGQAAARKVLTKDDSLHVGLADVDWSSWTPGDVETATKLLSGVHDAEMLNSLLAAEGITIKSVAANRMDDLARAIADGIGEGTSIGDLTGIVSDVLDDPYRAEMVARTETTRVMVAGAMDTYADSGIGYAECMSAMDSGVCVRCNENEEAGPVSIWGLPPNGWPPTHPNCRCTTLPVVP